VRAIKARLFASLEIRQLRPARCPPDPELERFRILTTTEAADGRDGVAFNGIWIVEALV
jgi:hypothetical protein